MKTRKQLNIMFLSTAVNWKSENFEFEPILGTRVLFLFYLYEYIHTLNILLAIALICKVYWYFLVWWLISCFLSDSRWVAQNFSFLSHRWINTPNTVCILFYTYSFSFWLLLFDVIIASSFREFQEGKKRRSRTQGILKELRYCILFCARGPKINNEISKVR